MSEYKNPVYVAHER